jgi:phosphoserine phosphatase
MRELAEARGLDLDASWAYSDSASDLPMLRAVGHPVAVNPDRELALVAEAQGWQVMRFETLGRRLKLAAAVTAAAAAATAGRAALSTAR